MAVQKRRLDWTAIKNALRICGMELYRSHTGPFPGAPYSRHFLCNRGYGRYVARSNWSIFLTESETQNTELLVRRILWLSKER